MKRQPAASRSTIFINGNLATDYPHAGLLNTTVFLLRYPTTATNRNRARSRWTYYHFLGVDIEKSASRTTDPIALADTDNPTMRNPACTVCHSVMDPVAGAFQNYGDIGLYRDQYGGLDSLDGHYKEGAGSLRKVAVAAATYESRQTFAHTVWLEPGSRLAIRHYDNNGCGEDGDETCGRDLRIDDFPIRNLDGHIIDRIEWSELDEHCEYDGQYEAGTGGDDDHYRWWGWGCHEIPVNVREADSYELRMTVWADQAGGEVTSFKVGTTLYQEGDTWYRDMRAPGFDGEQVPDADDSLPWLAQRMVEDDRFAQAAVKFWWPAIVGRKIAEPPEDENDADFEGRLLASNAQAAEVQRLARDFRRGFDGGSPYNLKDLLVEIVLSRWFRAQTLSDDDPVRRAALREAGAKRLLTPEELARKTLALTGFQWGRPHIGFQPPVQAGWSTLSDSETGYGLLYGGIDSAGVTERASDLTSVMAGVAQSHATESSCPIVQREFYLLPEEDRLLFGGIDRSISPVFEFGSTFEVEAASQSALEIFSVRGSLRAGESTVSLAFFNDYAEDNEDRNLRLDRLALRNSQGAVVETRELETLDAADSCNHPVGEHFAFHCSGSVDVSIVIPVDGEYIVEVVAWADQAGSELPKLEVAVSSDTERSLGSRRIKAKLVELYETLHGIAVTADSPEVVGAYDLFVDVWQRRRDSEYGGFFDYAQGVDCAWTSDEHYLDGFLENAFGSDWWDWDRISAYFDAIDMSDSHGVAETWAVILAYLMMDYRYLYL